MYRKKFQILLLTLFVSMSATSSVLASNLNAGIWISSSELADIKMEGSAWDQLKVTAKNPAGSANLSDKNQKNNTSVMAKALVYARCNLEPLHMQCSDISLVNLYHEVVGHIMDAMGTEDNGNILGLSRNLPAYVIAADLVGMPADQDRVFRSWLVDVINKSVGGRTLLSTHEGRPNDWGTHAGAGRVAAAIYLGDAADLDRAARVFKGWLGDRSSYSGFNYGKLDWQCDPSKPVGINPKDCTKDGYSIDGVLPDSQRSSGKFSWPPDGENSVYGALQGAIATAAMLHRAGYNAFEWQDKAILRAYQWLDLQANYSPEGDDTWQLPLVDYYYGTSYWDGQDTQPGKNVGWTDWTHSNRTGVLQSQSDQVSVPQTEPAPEPDPVPQPEPAPEPDPVPQPEPVLAPTVNLSADPSTTSANGITMLSWFASNADACIASGDWSGSKGTSGSEQIGSLSADATFKLSCTGEGGQSTDSVTVKVEPLANGTASLSWTPPTRNEDGSVLADLAGYEIGYGVKAGDYPNVIRIDNPGITSYVIENLSPNTYYFVIRAVDSLGDKSDPSNMVSKTIP